jgi:hypothetical protein
MISKTNKKGLTGDALVDAILIAVFFLIGSAGIYALVKFFKLV